MIALPVVLIITGASAVLILALAVAVAALSRHKKAGMGELGPVGARGLVETNLEPEGAVLVRGELWRAVARTGETLKRGRDVRVVGASRHLLEVEPTKVASPSGVIRA